MISKLDIGTKHVDNKQRLAFNTVVYCLGAGSDYQVQVYCAALLGMQRFVKFKIQAVCHITFLYLDLLLS